MMAEAQALVERLVAVQNADGGWPYQAGTSSWAEPTAFVLLALQSEENDTSQPALGRGITWLLSRQKSSGGWAPNANVQECTAVTSVATLAVLNFAAHRTLESLNAALTWTANQVYKDDLSLSLLLAKALNLPPARAPGSVAWYPGTAGWVAPTALASLVLLKADRETVRPDLRGIAVRSCSYLLSRRCDDGGWNHGGSKTRSENANAYPETTGLALLALRAATIAPPTSAITVARQFAKNPESSEGLAWIQLALHSPTEPIADPSLVPTPRTTRDAALRLLSLSALRGKNMFLETIA